MARAFCKIHRVFYGLALEPVPPFCPLCGPVRRPYIAPRPPVVIRDLPG